MIRPGNRTEYQDEIVNSSGQRILIGGRQIGKTEVCAQEIGRQFRNHNGVVALAPTHQMSMLLSDRVRDSFTNQRTTKTQISQRSGTGHVEFVSDHEADSVSDLFRYFEGHKVHAIVVDEANCVSQQLLFEIEHEFDGDVLLTATPRPGNTVVEMWAKHSPYWDTWQVGTDEAPFVRNERVEELQEQFGVKKELREIHGEVLE